MTSTDDLVRKAQAARDALQGLYFSAEEGSPIEAAVLAGAEAITGLLGLASPTPDGVIKERGEDGRRQDGPGLSLRTLHAANIARQAEWCPDQVPDLSFRGNELAGEVATQATACAEEVDRVRVEIGAVQAENERLKIIIRDREWKRDLAEQEVNQLSTALAESERKREEAVEALRPFAEFAQEIAKTHPGWDHDWFEIVPHGSAVPHLILQPFRAAQALLSAIITQEVENGAV